MEVFYGDLITFLGTPLGAVCVFFVKKGPERRRPVLTHRLCCRGDGGGLGVEPACPRHPEVRSLGLTFRPSGGGRLLDRHFVFADPRPHHSPPAHQEWPGRGPQKPAESAPP